VAATWHVARADSYDVPGAPADEFDDEPDDHEPGAGDEAGNEPADGLDRPAPARPAEPF
jgi:hypothetical protein